MIAEKKKKAKKWLQPQHKVVVPLIRCLLSPIILWLYGLRVEKFREENGRQYLVLANHQTGFDQFYPSMAFKQHLYYVASEDIFSMGWLSKVIQWIAAPIPIKKQVTDIRAVMTCMKVAKEGGSIAMFPEGNRTFSGETGYINPAVGGLARKLGLPIAFFRIEDGYGIQPRWSDVVRGGTMKSYISRVMEPEEFANMTKEELSRIIEQELYVDEARVTGAFPHAKNAEFLERAMYVCPWCGLSTFESNGDIIRCTKCGKEIRHKSTKELEGIGVDFPHRFVADWYDWQNAYICNTDLSQLTEEPVYEETVQLSKVHVYKYKELLKKDSVVRLYGNRITVDDRVFPFETLGAVVVLGKNKVNLYTGNEILQLKGDKRFNALKYVNFFHKFKNDKEGKENGQFLGL